MTIDRMNACELPAERLCRCKCRSNHGLMLGVCEHMPISGDICDQCRYWSGEGAGVAGEGLVDR